MPSLFAWVLGGGLLLGSFAALYYAVRYWEAYRLVSDTPTTRVADIEEGVVELKGRVSEATETANPTIHDATEPVAEAWQVEEWSESGDHSTWRTVALGVDGGEFVLETDGGEVAVDVPSAGSGTFSTPESILSTGATGVFVDGVSMEVRSFPYEQVPPDGDVPASIREFVAARRDVGEQTGSITNVVDIGNKHGERRYHGQDVSVGDEVYVLGYARPDDDAPHPPRPEHFTVGEHPDGDPFVISTLGEDRLVSKQRTRAIVAAVVAVLALAAGAFVLLGGVPI